MFADYIFYVNEFCGRLDLKDFERFLPRADAILESMTFGRIKAVTRDVSMAVCAIAERLNFEESALGKRAEKAGDISVTYLDPQSNAYRVIALTYLKNTDVLYRGLREV